MENDRKKIFASAEIESITKEAWGSKLPLRAFSSTANRPVHFRTFRRQRGPCNGSAGVGVISDKIFDTAGKTC